MDVPIPQASLPSGNLTRQELNALREYVWLYNRGFSHSQRKLVTRLRDRLRQCGRQEWALPGSSASATAQ
jgi:hypothetical protein